MNRYVHSRTKTWIILLLVHSAGLARAQETDVVSEAHAKGIVVLRASFPSRGELQSYGLEISMDGEAFVDANVGPTRGLRFGCKMVRGSHETDSTVLVVPVVGRFGLGVEDFLFGQAGTYELRWDITFKDRDVGDLKIEQTVVVGAPTEVDLQFLARAGDRDFQAEVFGLHPPERGTTDLLALGMVSELLQHAQDDASGDGDASRPVGWADALMDLAREFPESSYTPYAALCAGRIYMGHLVKLLGGQPLGPNAKTHGFYKKGDKALRFSIDHADAFLKPRALCSLGVLRICAGSWNEAEQLFAEAVASAQGQGTVERVVKKLRRDASRLREQPRTGHGED